MNAIVTIINDTPVTTSLAIAEGTENDHASVIKLVRAYQSDLEEFGLLDFKSESTGGRPTEYEKKKWHLMSEEMQDKVELYVNGFGETLEEAIIDANLNASHAIPIHITHKAK